MSPRASTTQNSSVIYPFGMVMPGREYSGEGYKFGFNGKEVEQELAGDNYDFGARLYEARLGRWLTCDFKAQKYPNETPYSFCSNIVLVSIDPDGNERIVVTGGADNINAQKMNFVMASKVQLANYVNSAKASATEEQKASNSYEQVTWIIFDLDYSNEQKSQFEEFALNNGIAPPIYIKTAADLVTYINNKSNISTVECNNRRTDLISEMSNFSHGTPSKMTFGYGNDVELFGYDYNTEFTRYDANSLDKEAFATGSIWEMYSCNPATPESSTLSNYSSKSELITDCTSKESLVSAVSGSTGQTATGYIGRVDYVPSGRGELPCPGGTGGDYSPTVEGKSIKAIKVTSTNGTITKTD